MFNFWQVLALMAAIMIFGLCCGVGAAWIWFRASRQPIIGETFRGKVPKGEVFSVLDPLDAVDEPEAAEKNVMARTEEFLAKLGGVKS
ncbi:MAG: hypothetical protein WAZ60_23715 [Desulfosalsimonadaceae bacterium]